MDLINHIKKLDNDLNSHLKEINTKKDIEIPTYPLSNEINKNYISTLKINSFPIKNLILSGCGVRGFAYLGVFQVLEELKLINNIEKVYATSAGAIIGTLFSIGYSSSEIMSLLKQNDFSKLKNPLIENLLDNYGLDDGNKFIDFLIKMFEQKKISKNINFKQLYEKTGIELTLTGTNLNKLKAKYFNYKITPKIKVINAVRISMSFPGYFTPVKLNKNLYVDGGLIDNFPIHKCNDCLDNTFGIYISQEYEHTKEIPNLESYVGQVILALIQGYNIGFTKNYEKYILQMDLPNINPLNFNLTFEDIKSMKDYAYDKTLDYLIHHHRFY